MEYKDNVYEYTEYPCTILKYKASSIWQKLAGLHLVINVNNTTEYPKWEDIYQYKSYQLTGESPQDVFIDTGFEEDGLVQKNDWVIKEIYEPTNNLLLAGRIKRALVPVLVEDTSGTKTTTISTTTTTTTTDTDGNVVTTETTRDVTTSEQPQEDTIEEGVLANFVNTTFSIDQIKGVANEYGNLFSDSTYSASNPNQVTQIIEFREGYTWFGLYVSPTDGNKITDVLNTGNEEVNQKVFGGMSQSTYTNSIISSGDPSWTNKSYIFDNNRGHIMYIPSDGDDDIVERVYTMTIVGDVKEEHDIIMYPGWSWITYPSVEERNISDVLPHAQLGDKVLGAYGQTSYINRFGLIGWSNSSFQMKPGQMYKVYNAGNDAIIEKIIFSDSMANTVVTTTTTTTTTTTYSKDDSTVIAVVEENDKEEQTTKTNVVAEVNDIVYKLRSGWNELQFGHKKVGLLGNVILNPDVGDKILMGTSSSEYTNIFGTVRWSATLILKPNVTYKYYTKGGKFLKSTM
tara:strand:- start:649 stop:2190 length:1542 start_codon:yes stop_codon:yes gene_type:complete